MYWIIRHIQQHHLDSINGFHHNTLNGIGVLDNTQTGHWALGTRTLKQHKDMKK